MGRRFGFSPINRSGRASSCKPAPNAWALRIAKAPIPEILNLAVEGVRAAGLENFSVQIGDLALFAGLVDALDIPAQWRGR